MEKLGLLTLMGLRPGVRTLRSRHTAADMINLAYIKTSDHKVPGTPLAITSVHSNNYMGTTSNSDGSFVVPRFTVG